MFCPHLRWENNMIQASGVTTLLQPEIGEKKLLILLKESLPCFQIICCWNLFYSFSPVVFVAEWQQNTNWAWNSVFEGLWSDKNILQHRKNAAKTSDKRFLGQNPWLDTIWARHEILLAWWVKKNEQKVTQKEREGTEKKPRSREWNQHAKLYLMLCIVMITDSNCK